MAKSLKESISIFFKENENSAGLDFGKIISTWNQTVGSPINKKTEIISYEFGTITVKAQNPVWRNELSFQKNEILKKLKLALPGINIKEIQIK